MSTPRRVCVIGAQGALGNTVVRQFAAAGWTVHPAGRRPDRRAGFRHLDLDRPETIGPALRDVDLTVSTVSHPGLTAERMVLERGGVLVNCSHTYARAAAALKSEAKETKGTVLLNAGLAPGVANLAAAQLLENYPQADCLEVAFTILSEGTVGKAGGEFAYEGLASKSHHSVVKLPMGETFGRLPCIEVAEQEDFGFGGIAGSRPIKIYLGFGDRPLRVALRAVNGLHLMRMLPKAAFTARRGKHDNASEEPTAVWIGARLGVERLGASVIECEGGYRTTAASAHAFSENLVDDNRPGCFNPEDLFSPDDLASSLRGIGLRVTQDATA
jgi:hypothetical protein